MAKLKHSVTHYILSILAILMVLIIRARLINSYGEIFK